MANGDVILTADDDIVIWDDKGVHSISIEKDSKTVVPLLLVSEAVKNGAYVPGSKSTAVKVQAGPSDKVHAIVAAYREILATGDVEQLDGAGIPRIDVLESKVGRTNKTDREAAWVIVEG